MLWAIDVGNTHTVVGLYQDGWRAVWRLATHSGDTEDELAAQLSQLCDVAGLAFKTDGVVIGSVVPSITHTWAHFAQKWLGREPVFLECGHQVGLEVVYKPANAVGADRIANALAALDLVGAPVVVVDFGTATTFDTIDGHGRYLGGAILPGVLVSLEALSQRAAKLPQVSLEEPTRAIGTDTVSALRSGVMFGYAGAVDAILERILAELASNTTVLATGGLAGSFMKICRNLSRQEPNLTLDGLRLAFQRLTGP
jgi:type III pantothenate kinase